ncbi:FliH/SctL family protein [Eleftheria terrae]|uniref:FliH/SctL family protein n=1 Tax=Eleftheria terrae TaxID=1597781 RepID=UPI00263A9598|nr:FliH/SctL family protein [Eleftheria terrae]WKB51656.1 FliH/SctL family protein [Eleftheria terrae]
MDAVIRSVQLAPEKARLGPAGAVARPATPAQKPAGVAPSAPAAAAVPDTAALRRELETALRREMAGEAARLFEEERRRGHAQGLQDGLAQGRKDAAAAEAALQQQALQRIDAALARIEAEQRASLQRLQDDVGSIAFAAVCRILGEHAVTPAAVAACVGTQLQALPHQGPVTVRLHPSDVQALQPWLKAEGRSQPLVLVADDSLALGGCILESEHGRHDAGLDTQLRRLKAVIDAHREAQASHGA